jgi:hypothetical protein
MVVQGDEHFDGTLSDRDIVKANGGQGWPYEFAEGDVISAYNGNILWNLNSPISQDPEQEQSVFIVEGIDACRMIRSREVGIDQRVGVGR